MLAVRLARCTSRLPLVCFHVDLLRYCLVELFLGTLIGLGVSPVVRHIQGLFRHFFFSAALEALYGRPALAVSCGTILGFVDGSGGLKDLAIVFGRWMPLFPAALSNFPPSNTYARTLLISIASCGHQMIRELSKVFLAAPGG